MKMAPYVSFIIPTRNESLSVVRATINGLLDTTTRHAREILLIDDGSKVPIIFKHREVTVIQNPWSIGVSHCRRYGGSIAKGNVLVFLDAHMTFSKGWLEKMLAHVECGALLCSAAWDYSLSHCYCWGSDFGWWSNRNYGNGHTAGFYFRHSVYNPGRGAREVPLVIGACYMMLREKYLQLGGFSPLFRGYGADEFDISARAWISGFGVKCVTDAKVGHLYRKNFPYQVSWNNVEFNQLVLVKTVFENRTVKKLERCFNPIPIEVESWVKQTDWKEWRKGIQSRRQMNDVEFAHNLAPCLRPFLTS